MQPRTADRREKAATVYALVGYNVRERRLALKMTQRECSELLAGAHESYWRQLESGGKELSLLRLVEISEVLGVNVGDLLKGV